MSDLHVDAAPWKLPPTPAGADVLVIAGDVRELPEPALEQLVEWQRQCQLPIVFLPGNHDFYGGDLQVFETLPIDYRSLGIHILDRGQSVVLAGVRFVGATLWTDFEIFGDDVAAMAWAKAYMPDYTGIDLGMRRIWTRDIYAAHVAQLLAVESVLSRKFDGSTVVVTHHAPHPKSLANGHAVDAADASYASDLTTVIERWKPELWVHGHVHQSKDYTVGETRIICNPRGYVGDGTAIGLSTRCW